MADLIGALYRVRGLRTGSLPAWKPLLLVFDQLALPGATELTTYTGRSRELTSQAADALMLLERRVIIDTSFSRSTVSGLRPQALSEWEEAHGEIIDAGSAAADPHLDHADWHAIADQYDDASARMLALKLREVDGLDAVPLTSVWTRLPDRAMSRAEVIQLVVSELPVPGDSHSLEDILAFRDETKHLRMTLRVWMNEMASGKLTAVEVSDKLEDLVSRYERALNLEKMSRTTDVVETLVITTAEVAESLVKFQWSKVARKLFEVRHRQIDLMRAEMTLPGRELAYIVKARERFGK